jgi:hypothetical protein
MNADTMPELIDNLERRLSDYPSMLETQDRFCADYAYKLMLCEKQKHTLIENQATLKREIAKLKQKNVK